MKIKNTKTYQARISIEAGPRQSGKTTRQIKWLVENSQEKDLSDCVIYSKNMSQGMAVADQAMREVGKRYTLYGRGIKVVSSNLKNNLRGRKELVFASVSIQSNHPEFTDLMKFIINNSMSIKLASIELDV